MRARGDLMRARHDTCLGHAASSMGRRRAVDRAQYAGVVMRLPPGRDCGTWAASLRHPLRSVLTEAEAWAPAGHVASAARTLAGGRPAWYPSGRRYRANRAPASVLPR